MPPKKIPSRKPSSKKKAIEVSDDDLPEPVAKEKPSEKVYWEKDLSRTDRLLEWLEDNPTDRQKLFSDSAQDAKEENRARRVAKGAKSEFHAKIAVYVFSVDADAKVRRELVSNPAKYAKAVENCLGSLKTKYRSFNRTLGKTGSGLTVAEIRKSPHLSNLVDSLHDKLPCWERLHGFWRTLPTYNPYTVSSEPGQDLVAEAQKLLGPDSPVVLDEGSESPIEEVGGKDAEQDDADVEDIENLDKDNIITARTPSSREPSPVPLPSEVSATNAPSLVAGDAATRIQHKRTSSTPFKPLSQLRSTPTTTSSSSISTPTPNSRPSNNPTSTRKVSTGTKRARVDSLADTDSNKLVEMAAARQQYKSQALDVKRQKYSVEADRERYAAEERAAAAKERMMEKEH